MNEISVLVFYFIVDIITCGKNEITVISDKKIYDICLNVEKRSTRSARRDFSLKQW